MKGLDIRMTNDYLFRALLQRNNTVLKALIASLLHLDINHIISVKITNPIELGDAVDDKNFILDIRVVLNDNAIINLEMQVINEGDWAERSLCYLCRTFDNLNKGEKYTNDKTRELYSDKLTLSVLNLTQIELATEEDKYYNIDYWAKLFKATTWEELKMLAKSNEYMEEAAATVYRLTKEEKIRLQCEAREDYYRRTPLVETYEAQKVENEQLRDEIQQLNSELERLRQMLTEHNINTD